MAEYSYKGLYGNHTGKTFDILLQFAALAAMTDGTPTGVINVGTGLIDADLVVYASVSTGTNAIKVQFSRTADFGTVVDGIESPIKAGENIIPFRNAVENEIPYAYVRLMPTVDTALTAGAFIAKK